MTVGLAAATAVRGEEGGRYAPVFRIVGGADTISYIGDTDGVTIDLDGAADDGRRRELDQVGADIEDITGTAFADRLTGNAKPNFFIADAGDDVLLGLAGFDNLFGGPGTDTCDVGRGGGSAVDCQA
jgi:Ca2+-binding RTX toxin-like protein